MESVTETLCAAVLSAGGIVEAYRKCPGELSEAVRPLIALDWEALRGIVESGNLVLTERFRGHYEGPPKPIARVSGASFHELGLALVARIYHGIACELDCEEVLGKAREVLGESPRSELREFLCHKGSRFDAGRLIAHIRDEAARADRADRKPREVPDPGSDQAERQDSESKDTPEHPWGNDSPETVLSPAKIAERLGMPNNDNRRGALRQRLTTWRKANKAGGWIEDADAGGRKPKYLFPIGAVWAIVKDLKASS